MIERGVTMGEGNRHPPAGQIGKHLALGSASVVHSFRVVRENRRLEGTRLTHKDASGYPRERDFQ